MSQRPSLLAWLVMLSVAALVGMGSHRFASWATARADPDMLIGPVQWRAIEERFDSLPTRADLAAITRRVSLVEEANSANAAQLAQLESWRLTYARAVDTKLDLLRASIDKQSDSLVTMSGNIGKLTGILTTLVERKNDNGPQ